MTLPDAIYDQRQGRWRVWCPVCGAEIRSPFGLAAHLRMLGDRHE